MQQNNVNGWQNLENYRKSTKNTMETLQPEGTILKKTTKKQRKTLKTNKETIMNQTKKQWKTWKKSGTIMKNNDIWHIYI